MLVNLCCDKLIENNLSFGTGLNVLKGDDLATNSIGKSSVLMLIDFCFGGNDFINLCSDVIEEVGDLNVTFTFNFNKEPHCFLRNTYEPNKVIYINDFSELTLNDFTDFYILSIISQVMHHHLETLLTLSLAFGVKVITIRRSHLILNLKIYMVLYFHLCFD